VLVPISISLKLCLYVVPFLRYSASKKRRHVETGGRGTFLEICVRGHSRSFKLVPFESLGAVSYSPSIVTMAVYLTVYEILSVKV